MRTRTIEWPAGRPGRGGSRWSAWTTGALVAVAAASTLGAAPVPATAQEREEEDERSCRCVDARALTRAVTEQERPLRTRLRARLTSGTGARIGVMVGGDTDAEDRDPRGVVLLEVVDDSPAERAGLRPGDVVVEVGGHGVLESGEDEVEGRRPAASQRAARRFVALVRDLEPGEPAEIEYLRDGEVHRTTVVPEGPARPEALERLERLRQADRPRIRAGVRPLLRDRLEGDRERLRVITGALDRCGAPFAGEGRCVDGLHLHDLNPDLAGYFDTDEGVLVTEVAEGSTLGARAGDVIVAVGGRGVADVGDVRRILRSYEPDEQVTLTVVRRGEEMQLQGTRR